MAAVPSIGRATRVERQVAAGADAAGDLYERYSGQIYGYCLRQLGSREEAEDAVQTTFMNAFRGLQRGIVPELESAWLFKIAHNVCLSRRRSSWRRGRVEAPNNFEVLQEVVPGRDQVADELIRLQDVLEQMPENQRRAILLREWQGLTYREIATELGLSQAATETLIFRARRALAQGLEQDADTWKRRLRRGADVGGAVAFIQALFSGGGAAALKVGATVVAVAATATASSAPGPAKEPQRTHATSPAKVAHVTRGRSLKRATGPAGITFAKPTARMSGAKTAARRLPAPTILAGPQIDESAPDAAAPETTSAPVPEQTATTPPAALPSPPADAPAPPAETHAAAPAPAETSAPTSGRDGPGKERSEKGERHPQAATPEQTEPPAITTTAPAAPDSDPAAEPPAEHRDRSDARERPARPDRDDRRDAARERGDDNK